VQAEGRLGRARAGAWVSVLSFRKGRTGGAVLTVGVEVRQAAPENVRHAYAALLTGAGAVPAPAFSARPPRWSTTTRAAKYSL
jgi:hypothetical protein